jgi:hypothetical protein
VQLVDQWRAIEQSLPEGWEEVRLTLTTEQPGELDRAAHVLGSMGAGRLGDTLVVRVRRAGGAQGPEAARRLFGRLDEQRIWCTLQADTVSEEAPAAAGAPADGRMTGGPLAGQWAAQLATLPDDWGSLLCELEIDSTAHLPRVALLCAPLNPRRVRERRAFSFRVAKRAGYGTSVAMTKRCLERCDEEAMVGRVTIAGLFPETDNVATQGPVFVVGGRPL